MVLPSYDFTLFAQHHHLVESLRHKRLFITGGTGFIGKYLLAALAFYNDNFNADLTITVLSRNPAKFIASHPHLIKSYISFLQGDVRDFHFPAGYNADIIIHGATDASAQLNEENPFLMLDTIYTGTHRVLEFAAQVGATDLLLLSSGAVYGKQPPELGHVSEQCLLGPDVLAPASAYGEGKRVSELLCAASCTKNRSLNVKIARCFAFVGPYLPIDLHFAIGNFMNDVIHQRQEIIIKGDGRPLRSYQYGADLVIWLLTILVAGKHLRPYNVGSSRAVSIKETAECVRDVARELLPSSSTKIVVLSPIDASTAPTQYVPSVVRAEEELGLREYTPLHEAVRHTMQWHLIS